MSAPQKVPIERFHVPDVKNDPVPLGDGPVVKRLGPHDSEQLIGSRTRLGQSSQKSPPAWGAVFRRVACSSS
jgi:hypothetical protein